MLKGNVDVELTMQVLLDFDVYDKAIIVTGDGDFYPLVKYLVSKRKLYKLMVPNKRRYSFQLREFSSFIDFVGTKKRILEHKR